MTAEQIQEYRSEFRSIVSLRSTIKSHDRFITQLHRWDKAGSHLKAIDKAIAAHHDMKAKLKEKLKGRSYEEWKALSIKISRLSSDYKNAAKRYSSRTCSILNKISDLKF